MVTNLHGHVIPYNFISLKSNLPSSNRLLRALENGASKTMPMASMKVTRATLFRHGQGGGFRITGKCKVCVLRILKLKCGGGQSPHHNINELNILLII